MILICYGTRPEYIKLKPLIEEMSGVLPFKTLFTGQHKDLVKESADYVIEITEGRNRLDSIISSAMNSFDFKEEGITHVMVQGDTATAYAFALSAFHHKIPVIHLEAGMRTYDLENPYPEEFYRQCISKIASIHFAPTYYENKFLKQDMVDGEIHVVGNTVLDNLVGVPITYDDVVLITMHRRENHKTIPEYFKIFSKLAKDNPDLEFILPLHPNPDVQKHKELLKNITIVDPLPYDEMINTIARCRFVMSDSGGIQEEASFLKKKVIICREKTERLASLTNPHLLCRYPNDLERMFYQAKNEYIVNEDCPYGDGTTSKKIVEILKCGI